MINMQQEANTIIAKLVEHDDNFAEIRNKLTGHGEQFVEIQSKLSEHDERFVKIDKRFDKVESSIDLLATEMLKHEERLDRIEENMATKADINKIAGTLDHIVKLVEKKDQELTVAQDWMSRTDKRVDIVETDVRQMKPLLGLS